ncbi:hypothetical protein H0E87_001712 [Populus deltoides]|uniref:XS domain-containing protein n=1 Tax=Populus deltoides TaxID=3696 RepID=A0A8T2ZSS4_POPDE|nr:hypothetical protein H0E87_001712 [Populus deltoides]
MSYKSEERDISESEFQEEYELRKYEYLKRERIRVSNSVYRCTYCIGKRYYHPKELPQHASNLDRGSQRRTRGEQARHRALERFVRRYLCVEDSSEPSTTTESPAVCDRDKERLFVWPWMGVVANIPTQVKDGRRVGESGSKLRHELATKGFDPVTVHPLWSCFGHSGLAVVEFKNGWDGFNNAIMFEKDFDLNHCGKKDYVTILERDRGQRLYGWIARDDDYKANGLLGEHLRKNGDLKTVCGKEAEDQRKDAKLLCNLTSTLKEKYDHLREMEIRYEETTQSLIKVMDQKDSMVKSYNEEIRKMQQIAHHHFAKISLEHEKATQQLLAKREELVQCEKKLQQREVQIENERSKLLLEKKMVTHFGFLKAVNFQLCWEFCKMTEIDRSKPDIKEFYINIHLSAYKSTSKLVQHQSRYNVCDVLADISILEGKDQSYSFEHL